MLAKLGKHALRATNMLPGEVKRTSAIDDESEKDMRSQLRSMESRNFSTDEDMSSFQMGENMDEEKTSYAMSENGKTLLKKLEGCVKNEEGLLVPYNDSNNFATKGYGILICKSPLTDEIIAANPPQTEEQATSDFENKLADFESILNNRATYTYPNGVQTVDKLLLSETEADAIISLTYNSPKTAKKVMDAIRNDKTQNELQTIWMDGNSTDSGLGKRRAAEWKLYSEGTYEENPYD